LVLSNDVSKPHARVFGACSRDVKSLKCKRVLIAKYSHCSAAKLMKFPTPFTRRALLLFFAASLCAAALSALAQPNAALLASTTTPTTTPTTTLKIGVLPFVSTRVLMTNYQPLRVHLEAELKQAVQLVTATDFRAFHAATLAREYDVVITAPNLAPLAQEARWQPLAVFEPGVTAVLVRSKAKPPGGVAALKAKRLALANPQSLVALRGFDWLAEQGLKRGVDYTTVLLRNDDSLYMALASGDVPYAIMSLGEFRAMPEPVRALLEVETEFARLMGFVVLAAPDTSPDSASRLQGALLRLASGAEGARFTELAGVRNLRALAPRELDAIDPYLSATRAGLQAPAQQ
jgi:phosphonate transport system substrate-binding protein